MRTRRLALEPLDASHIALMISGDVQSLAGTLHVQFPTPFKAPPLLGEGRQPTRDHCLKLADQAGIRPREAAPIIEQVNDAIARWPAFADQACCTKKVSRLIGKAIAAI